ncbi:hypothetical protein BGZ79_010654 [Entomortierella chlamydospora]|nr:hypothetical protein BGZ79_010654 [Entomortierella chlamydospora]
MDTCLDTSAAAPNAAAATDISTTANAPATTSNTSNVDSGAEATTTCGINSDSEPTTAHNSNTNIDTKAAPTHNSSTNGGTEATSRNGSTNSNAGITTASNASNADSGSEPTTTCNSGTSSGAEVTTASDTSYADRGAKTNRSTKGGAETATTSDTSHVNSGTETTRRPTVRPPNIADSLTTAQPKIKSPLAPSLPQLSLTSPLHAPQMPALVPMSRPPNSENTTATAQPKTRYLPPTSSLSHPPPLHPPPLHPPPASISLTPSRLYEIKTRIKVVHAEMQQELDKARRIVTEHERLQEGWDEGGTDMETETASIMQRTKETKTPKTANCELSVEDDPAYISAIYNAKRLKEELENLNANLTPERLAVVAKKITKALKRKEWKKRRITKMQEYRDTTEERRRKLNAEIDRKCEKILARDKKKEKRKLAKQVAKQERRQERRQEARKIAQGKQTVALVQKLQRLKTLRRERMKRAGHFFPEEDNEFFERIHKAEEALKQPIEKSANWDTNSSKKQMEKEKKFEVGLEKQEIVNTKCSSAKVGMSPLQDNESNAAENAPVLDEITVGTDTGTSKRKPCQVDVFEDSLQTDVPIDQTILPPTKMQKLGQGSSQQQQLLQAQQESQLLSEKDQEQGCIVSLELPTHFTPEQPNVEGSTSTALILGRVRRKKLGKPINYRDVWSSYQISQKDGLRKERIATPIPDGLRAPPDKPSSLEWAKYLV